MKKFEETKDQTPEHTVNVFEEIAVFRTVPAAPSLSKLEHPGWFLFPSSHLDSRIQFSACDCSSDDSVPEVGIPVGEQRRQQSHVPPTQARETYLRGTKHLPQPVITFADDKSSSATRAPVSEGSSFYNPTLRLAALLSEMIERAESLRDGEVTRNRNLCAPEDVLVDVPVFGASQVQGSELR